jgi:hypothetical protein
MPIEDTPAPQVVVAVATKWMGEAALDPELGDVTVTVANAGIAHNATRAKRCFIEALQRCPVHANARLQKQLHRLQLGQEKFL